LEIIKKYLESYYNRLNALYPTFSTNNKTRGNCGEYGDLGLGLNLGIRSDQTIVNNDSIAIGENAGEGGGFHGPDYIAIGKNAGKRSIGDNSIRIGNCNNELDIGKYSIYIGSSGDQMSNIGDNSFVFGTINTSNTPSNIVSFGYDTLPNRDISPGVYFFNVIQPDTYDPSQHSILLYDNNTKNVSQISQIGYYLGLCPYFSIESGFFKSDARFPEYEEFSSSFIGIPIFSNNKYIFIGYNNAYIYNLDKYIISIGSFEKNNKMVYNDNNVIMIGQYLTPTDSEGIDITTNPNTKGGNSISMGLMSGNYYQKSESIAIGTNSGKYYQNEKSIAIGYDAGNRNQGTASIAIGKMAGKIDQGSNSIAIGSNSGTELQGHNSISIGTDCGAYLQGESSIAIGTGSANENQKSNSIAIGSYTGRYRQDTESIAIGKESAHNGQSMRCIAIGNGCGYTNQGENAIVIGYNSARENQGANSIVIGNNSGKVNQCPKSIIINAHYTQIENTDIEGLFIKPIRKNNTPVYNANILEYNSNTKEITYYNRQQQSIKTKRQQKITNGTINGSLKINGSIIVPNEYNIKNLYLNNPLTANKSNIIRQVKYDPVTKKMYFY